MKSMIAISFMLFSSFIFGQSVYPVKSISLRSDTIENNKHQMYIAITQVLQNNDSTKITVFGNKVWLHDTKDLSLAKPYKVVIGKTSFDIHLSSEDKKIIYSLDNLMLDHSALDWKETYLKIFFKDEQNSRSVILMAQINDYVLYNIGYELR